MNANFVYPGLLSSIKGSWGYDGHQGEYTIHFDPQDIRKPLAEITCQGKVSYWSAEWKTCLASKERICQVLRDNLESVTVRVKKDDSRYSIKLSSTILKTADIQVIRRLNEECFTCDEGRVSLHACYFNEEENKNSRVKFLKKLIADTSTENEIASRNALAIFNALSARECYVGGLKK